MDALNYHHLRYFWAVAREGGVTRASERLHVSQPTISAQVAELEGALGEQLFTRSGRRLALTEMGRIVFRYADEIFGLGRDLVEAVRGAEPGRPVRLTVGLSNAVPKLVAHRLLEPALRLPDVRMECYEDRTERLLGDLAVHDLDLVLADAPVAPGLHVRAFSHLLGECGVGFFGTSALVGPRRRGFPRSLEGAPLLLPTANTSLGRALEQWLRARGIRPRIVGEFEDSALLTVFGAEGAGLFPAPLAIAPEVRRQYRVQRLGTAAGVRERFYAITVERRIQNPAVAAISSAARERLFA